MRRFRLLVAVPGLDMSAIFCEKVNGYTAECLFGGYVGFPKNIVENNPHYFEEIKEPEKPKSYFYINDRLEIIEETWPTQEWSDIPYVDMRQSDYWKWMRIKAGNCFDKQVDAQTAKQHIEKIFEVFGAGKRGSL